MKLNAVVKPSRWLVLGACVAASASGGCATGGVTGDATTEAAAPPSSAVVPLSSTSTGGGSGGGASNTTTTTNDTPMDPYTGKPVVFWSMCADQGEENWTKEGPDGVPGKKCEFLRSDVPQRHFSYYPPRSLVESESGKDEIVTPPVTPSAPPAYTAPI